MTAASPTELTSPAFFMADHAAVESGKLYVNGGFWNRLAFASFPATVSFGVVAVVLVPWHDSSTHRFTIRFEDPDGGTQGGLLEGELAAGVTPSARAGDPTLVPLAAMVSGFVVQRPGDYTAVLEIDGERKNTWPFRASVQPAAGGSGVSHDDPTNIPPLL